MRDHVHLPCIWLSDAHPGMHAWCAACYMQSVNVACMQHPTNLDESQSDGCRVALPSLSSSSMQWRHTPKTLHGSNIWPILPACDMHLQQRSAIPIAASHALQVRPLLMEQLADRVHLTCSLPGALEVSCPNQLPVHIPCTIFTLTVLPTAGMPACLDHMRAVPLNFSPVLRQ